MASKLWLLFLSLLVAVVVDGADCGGVVLLLMSSLVMVAMTRVGVRRHGGWCASWVQIQAARFGWCDIGCPLTTREPTTNPQQRCLPLMFVGLKDQREQWMRQKDAAVTKFRRECEEEVERIK